MEAEPGLIWPQTGNTFSLGLSQISVPQEHCVFEVLGQSPCSLHEAWVPVTWSSVTPVCPAPHVCSSVTLLPSSTSLFCPSPSSLYLFLLFSILGFLLCASFPAPLPSSLPLSSMQVRQVFCHPAIPLALVSSYENKLLVLGLVLDFFFVLIP